MVGWVITCTLDGRRMAFSSRNNQFALTPVSESGFIKDALFWSTIDEASEHLKKQLSLAPQLTKFGPFDILEMMIPH